MTPAELIQAAAGIIPLQDAEFLLVHLLSLKRHELYLETTRVPEHKASEFNRLASEAKNGVPVQYLVNSAPFLDFFVYVDRRVLIPRPETEELVTRSVSRLSNSGTRHSQLGIRNPPFILDYGTGSGCIAIALARQLNHASVLAVDTSTDALDVARMNVEQFGLADRVILKQASNLDDPVFTEITGKKEDASRQTEKGFKGPRVRGFKRPNPGSASSQVPSDGSTLESWNPRPLSLPAEGGGVDLLISNPPYIPSEKLPMLDTSVRNYEPKIGLDGGPKGTNILAMLIKRGPQLLAPDGLLALEIDSTQADLLKQLAPGASIEKDLAGQSRYLFLRKERAS